MSIPIAKVPTSTFSKNQNTPIACISISRNLGAMKNIAVSPFRIVICWLGALFCSHINFVRYARYMRNVQDLSKLVFLIWLKIRAPN